MFVQKPCFHRLCYVRSCAVCAHLRAYNVFLASWVANMIVTSKSPEFIFFIGRGKIVVFY